MIRLATNLATNIRYFRELNHWTQQNLADYLNISRSMIAKWENQTGQPDLDMLIKLSELFEISLDQLIGRAIDKNEVLREIERIYASDKYLETEDNNVIQLIDFILKHKRFNDSFIALAEMPVKKQRAILSIIEKTIAEINKI